MRKNRQNEMRGPDYRLMLGSPGNMNVRRAEQFVQVMRVASMALAIIAPPQPAQHPARLLSIIFTLNALTAPPPQHLCVTEYS